MIPNNGQHRSHEILGEKTSWLHIRFTPGLIHKLVDTFGTKCTECKKDGKVSNAVSCTKSCLHAAYCQFATFSMLYSVEFLKKMKESSMEEQKTVNNPTLSGAHSRAEVEKHGDVIDIVSFPPLFYSMSASLTSLPFGVPIPLSASLFLPVCFFPISLYISTSLSSPRMGLSVL